MTKTVTRATDESQQSQCDGKKQYPSRRAVLRDLRNIKYRGLHPYLCPHCHWFHAGNNLRGSQHRSAPYRRERFVHDEDTEQ